MRRFVCFALFALAFTTSSMAIIPIGVLCPIAVSNGIPLQVNYGPFFLDTVQILGTGAQVNNITCSYTTPGFSYATMDITAPNGFSLDFENTSGNATFSQFSGTDVLTLGSTVFYSTSFTATGSSFGTENNLFLGIGIQGGKPGASWTGTSNSLVFDPPSGNFFVTLYDDSSVPGSLPTTPEPSTLILLASGFGAALLSHRLKS